MPIVETETVEVEDLEEDDIEYSEEYLKMIDEEFERTKAEIAAGTAQTFDDLWDDILKERKNKQ
jgi:hypothetical protein